MERTLLVGLGGFLGASARYWVGHLISRALPAHFPYPTLWINITGCFGIGVLMTLIEERAMLGPDTRLFAVVGILGGYTTFSTFGYETVSLIRQGHAIAALLNISGQVILGLLAVWLGALSAR